MLSLQHEHEKNDYSDRCLKKTNILSVKTNKESTYDICFSYGLIDDIASILNSWLSERKALIVTTPTVSFLYGRTLFKKLKNAGIDVVLKVLPCSEKSKTLTKVERVCTWAQENELGRKGVLISFGGGVCMDIVTVAASHIYRGISYIRIPTTLIGLVDAGIGIKGAINFNQKKSYLGCFTPPFKVIIAPFFLRTLSRDYIKDGFSEIFKMALIRDSTLFELVKKHGPALIENHFEISSPFSIEILQRSIYRMIEELEPNIYENKTYERLVDFGHTFSQLLEEKTDNKLSHGKAVAVDMALSSVLACDIGLISKKYRDTILHILKSLGLPLYVKALTPTLCIKALQIAAAYRAGTPNLVLPTGNTRSYFLKDPRIITDEMLQNSINLLAKVNG